MAKKQQNFTGELQQAQQAMFGTSDQEQEKAAPAKQEYYRFNMRFPIEMKSYLQEISWQNRTDITAYITELVRKDMEAHPNWRDSLDALNK